MCYTGLSQHSKESSLKILHCQDPKGLEWAIFIYTLLNNLLVPLMVMGQEWAISAQVCVLWLTYSWDSN